MVSLINRRTQQDVGRTDICSSISTRRTSKYNKTPAVSGAHSQVLVEALSVDERPVAASTVALVGERVPDVLIWDQDQIKIQHLCLKDSHLLECLRVRKPAFALPTVRVGTSSFMAFSTVVRLECLDASE